MGSSFIAFSFYCCITSVLWKLPSEIVFRAYVFVIEFTYVEYTLKGP